MRTSDDRFAFAWRHVSSRYWTLTSGTMVLVVVSLILGSCATISGKLPASPTLYSGGAFRAGAATVDITPVPGYPLAGHSIAAKVSRGHWLRLHARAIFLEAEDGQRLVLVINDLLAIPAGLTNRVAQIIGTGSPACIVRPEAMIIAATHTHQGPGNYFSAPLYNMLAAPKPGFDIALFDFLAQRIAHAITEACESSQPAKVYFSSARLKNFAKNRSFPPFLLDAESKDFLASNSDLPFGAPNPEYPYRDAYRAIDPSLRVLRIETASSPSTIIAFVAFVAAHPTSMSHDTAVYSSDFFGVAAVTAEQELKRRQGRSSVVAIFNGPEGDVSPDWLAQDRRDALRLGRLLGSAILESRDSGKRVDGAINFRTRSIPFANRCATTAAGHKHCTAMRAAAGLPLLGGAQDGRSVSHYEGCVEGLVRLDRERYVNDPQGPKTTEPEAGCRIPFVIPIPSTTVVTALFPAPSYLPFGVYQLGPLAVVAVPGEFTTVMGKRIRDVVKDNMTPVPTDVLIIGLANEYLSYFTTPEEYDAQHYEGASTLHGKWSGAVALDELTLLAKALRQGAPAPLPSQDYLYRPGFAVHFAALASADAFRRALVDDLTNILLDQTTGLPLGSQTPSFCWKEPALNYRLPNGIPAIAVQTRTYDGLWRPLLFDRIAEDDQGTNIVFGIEQVENYVATACVFWIPPPQTLRGTFRFQILTAAGNSVESPAIDYSGGLSRSGRPPPAE